MKKRIYKNMLNLTIASVIAVVFLLTIIFYGFFREQIKNEIKTQAILLSKALSYQQDNIAYLNSLQLNKEDDRVTLITHLGEVIYDNYVEVSRLFSHLERSEIKDALSIGFGEDQRFSDSLNKVTYYYAIYLEDGDILRVSKTMDGIINIFFSIMPFILLIVIFIIIICHFISLPLTNKIIAPINEINLDEQPIIIYEELSPLINKIINQKKQINKQMITLEDRANTIETITHDMKEGLILLDVNSKILSSNQSAVVYFNKESKSFINKHLLDLTRNVQIIDNAKKAIHGNAQDIIMDFEENKVHVFFNPVFQNEKSIGAIILFLDITEKANAEQMRQEFSANVSHELKTPLTTISGYAELIENKLARGADIFLFAGKIKDEVTRLIALIEDIIKLSQLDEEKGTKHMEAFDLLDLLLSTSEILQPIADNNEVDIQIVGNHSMLTADKNMISELVYNLMENGIKYNKPKGSLTVEILNEIYATIIKVSDNGIGIPKEHHERIFERFYRVDKSRSRKTGGTGLGLSIVKHIVKYHDGNVVLISEEGIGTTVIVTLNHRADIKI